MNRPRSRRPPRPSSASLGGRPRRTLVESLFATTAFATFAAFATFTSTFAALAAIFATLASALVAIFATLARCRASSHGEREGAAAQSE